MYFSSCLFYALDRLIAEGGGLVIVSSDKWRMVHCEHISRQGVTTQFRPPSDLKAAWHALFGFYGVVEPGDIAKRLPPYIPGMLFGAALLFPFGLIWAIKRSIEKLLRGIP